jgi:hypothetical protein
MFYLAQRTLSYLTKNLISETRIFTVKMQRTQRYFNLLCILCCENNFRLKCFVIRAEIIFVRSIVEG